MSTTLSLTLYALAVSVGGSFGPASADATVIDSSTIEIAVSVEAAAGSAVVVHALDPGSDQQTVAMLEVASGLYRTRFETRPVDLVVVFEDLASGAESDPVRLTDLGVASDLVGVLELEPVADDSESPLGWLALGLALASLSALAFWVLGGDRGRSSPEDSTPTDVENVD